MVWQTCYRLTFHTLVTTHKKIPLCQQVDRPQTETRQEFQEYAAALLGHLLSVVCVFLCFLQSPWLTVVTMESECFLSPVCLLINPEKVEALVFTHTVYPHASAFLSVLAQCTVVSHWRRLQMSPRTRFLPALPPSLSQRTTDFVAFDFGIRLIKAWGKREVSW